MKTRRAGKEHEEESNSTSWVDQKNSLEIAGENHFVFQNVFASISIMT